MMAGSESYLPLLGRAPDPGRRQLHITRQKTANNGGLELISFGLAFYQTKR